MKSPVIIILSTWLIFAGQGCVNRPAANPGALFTKEEVCSKSWLDASSNKVVFKEWTEFNRRKQNDLVIVKYGREDASFASGFELYAYVSPEELFPHVAVSIEVPQYQLLFHEPASSALRLVSVEPRDDPGNTVIFVTRDTLASYTNEWLEWAGENPISPIRFYDTLFVSNNVVTRSINEQIMGKGDVDSASK